MRTFCASRPRRGWNTSTCRLFAPDLVQLRVAPDVPRGRTGGRLRSHLPARDPGPVLGPAENLDGAAVYPLDGLQLGRGQDAGILRLQVEVELRQPVHGVGHGADALRIASRLVRQDDSQIEIALPEHELGRPRVGVACVDRVDAGQRQEPRAQASHRDRAQPANPPANGSEPLRAHQADACPAPGAARLPSHGAFPGAPGWPGGIGRRTSGRVRCACSRENSLKLVTTT